MVTQSAKPVLRSACKLLYFDNIPNNLAYRLVSAVRLDAERMHTISDSAMKGPPTSTHRRIFSSTSDIVSDNICASPGSISNSYLSLIVTSLFMISHVQNRQ